MLDISHVTTATIYFLGLSICTNLFWIHFHDMLLYNYSGAIGNMHTGNSSFTAASHVAWTTLLISFGNQAGMDTNDFWKVYVSSLLSHFLVSCYPTLESFAMATNTAVPRQAVTIRLLQAHSILRSQRPMLSRRELWDRAALP